MDKILFHKMEFYGYHGVYPEENKLGQRFFVDLELALDLSPAGQSDDLSKTVDYAEVYQLVQTEVEGEPCALIETLAEGIAGKLLATFSLLEEVRIRITKPDPPIPGHYQSVGVEIRRSRP